MNRNEQEGKGNLTGKSEEYNASLLQNAPQMPDAPSMNDSRANVENEHLVQNASEDREVAPEFGDAADPAAEELGTHHRDE